MLWARRACGHRANAKSERTFGPSNFLTGIRAFLHSNAPLIGICSRNPAFRSIDVPTLADCSTSSISTNFPRALPCFFHSETILTDDAASQAGLELDPEPRGGDATRGGSGEVVSVTPSPQRPIPSATCQQPVALHCHRHRRAAGGCPSPQSLLPWEGLVCHTSPLHSSGCSAVPPATSRPPSFPASCSSPLSGSGR